jgi:hypothetical protein
MADVINVMDLVTGETLEVPMTAEEIAQRKTDIAGGLAARATEDAATAATAAAKASGLAKLAKLGFTAEEIAAW